MLSVRRVISWQIIAIACAVALAVALSRFFPVVNFVAALQERVMSWGAWAGVCYPLLFAACNILLLPGGVLAVGGGFFFGLWWGFGAASPHKKSQVIKRGWYEKYCSAEGYDRVRYGTE